MIENGREVRHPLVSVIVPAYNVAEYVKTIYNSVLAQTYPDWELVFVDDCSTDQTAAVVQGIADCDPRVRLYKTEHNSGTPLRPRVKGAEMAEGEYVCPIDADDDVSADFIRELIDRALETGAEITLPIMRNCRSGEEVEIFDSEALDKGSVYTGWDLVAHTLYEWRFGMNGGLYEKEFYKKCLNYLLGLRLTVKAPVVALTESLMFIDEAGSRVLLMDAEKVAFAAKAVYNYRYNPDSVVEIKSARSFNILDSNMFIRQALLDHGCSEGPLWRRLQLHLSACLADKMAKYVENYSKLSAHDRREALETLKRAYRNYDPAEAAPAISKIFYVIFRSGFYSAIMLFYLRNCLKFRLQCFKAVFKQPLGRACQRLLSAR